MSEPISNRAAATRADDRQFAEWLMEWTAIEMALDTTPETDAAARNALLDRAIELERLILKTPGHYPPAIRAKAYVVRHLMEMTQAEELPAMLEIETFVEACVLRLWAEGAVLI